VLGVTSAEDLTRGEVISMSMFEPFFVVDGDKVERVSPLPEFDDDAAQVEVVMDKKTFVECYERWIKESEDKE